MSRALFVITEESRAKVLDMVTRAPPGTRIEMKAPKRTLPQNDRMWSALTDLSQQLKWHGIWLPAEQWKLIFLDALHREIRMVPNLDGDGFVALGRSTSDLSVSEMSDLLSVAYAFGASHGVVFSDTPEEPDARTRSPGVAG